MTAYTESVPGVVLPIAYILDAALGGEDPPPVHPVYPVVGWVREYGERIRLQKTGMDGQ
jgi:hypothetical protein